MRSRVSLRRRHSIVIDWRLTILPLEVIEAQGAERRRAADDPPFVAALTRAGERSIPNEEGR